MEISGSAARYFAQNFDAVLDMLVKSAGEAIFDHALPGRIKTHSEKSEFSKWIPPVGQPVGAAEQSL